MYNHYIPQSDGSYRRSTMPENNRRQPQGRPQQNQQHPQNQQNQQNHPPQQYPAPPPQQCKPQEPPREHCPEPAPQPPAPCNPRNDSILSFLRGLLPRDMDSTDLLVILILLLMNKEDDCDSISPMLTIALYFLL